MPSRSAVPIHSLVLVLSTIAPLLSTPVAAEAIYSFVDERGIVHLTNVPSDPRYQLTAQVPTMVSSDLSQPDQGYAPVLSEDQLTRGGGHFEPITIIAQPQNER